MRFRCCGEQRKIARDKVPRRAPRRCRYWARISQAVGAFLTRLPRLGGRHLAVWRTTASAGRRAPEAERSRTVRQLRTRTNPPLRSAPRCLRGAYPTRRTRLPSRSTRRRAATAMPEDFIRRDRARPLLAPELPSPPRSGICLCNHKRSPFALPARRSTSDAARLATFFIASRLNPRRLR